MFPLILLPVQIVLIVLSALFVIISQCCGSKKNRAMEQFLKQENLDYQVQSRDFMNEANSLEDFFGKVVVDNIVHEKKKAYAKQPNDMRGIAVNWDKWPNVARKVEDANVASKTGIKPMVGKAGGVSLVGQSTLAGSTHGKTKRVSQKKPGGTISQKLGSDTSVTQKSSGTESAAAKSTTQKPSATLGQKSEADREKSKKEEEETETETETDEEEETTDNEEEDEEGEESGDENEDDEEEDEGE